MPTINMHEAKTQLSKLVERALDGEEVVIARAGKPVVKLVPIEAPPAQSILGALQGRYRIPDDFDDFGREEIASMFDQG
ncbi:MAG: type II toxin-antitoxin system Phd/YefM family antitoxin [Trueperaceae bacterium]|nr:type II toxin-antitoxin system Phd/YefM family antitoxin [Trueperaceae bacterium]